MFRTNLEFSNQSSSSTASVVTTIFKQFKAFLLASTILFASAGAKIATPSSQIQLFYNEAGFSVLKDGVSYEIEDDNVDQNLKDLAPEELVDLLETQCIYVGQLNESEFALQVGSRRSQVFARAELGHIQVHLDEEGFHVIQNGESHKVQSYDVDKALRSMSTAQFAKFLEDNYVIVSQFDNGDFSLKPGMRCLGGGVWGWMAGAYAGKFITHFVCHGTILIIGACTGFAAPATIVALEATFLPSIEAAKHRRGLDMRYSWWRSNRPGVILIYSNHFKIPTFL